ncbi:PQQ-binding-like beta-propeller repeat protein [Agromyces sp. SYSU K20354]|uniref:PQQ-binding-like beta-propeller repeat protein n=1 Tax=Agromyces cavernae TaxID=2898659 RepID=UPI001E548AE0|nr:PQQ-binding-like beta-propeller repeat protein [Agromyces cavernae]MCD2443055.1 PQQ-binding-like beta-propeller repeat protein [Agromyces cavernae]
MTLAAFPRSPLSRRHLLQLGAAGGLALAASAATPAHASGASFGAAAAAQAPTVSVTDLGPAVTAFTHAGATLVGDTVYVASRNIDPMRVVGYHIPTGKVTSVTNGPGISTQLLVPDAAGRYLYSAIRQYNTAPGPGLIRLDLSQPGAPKEDLHDIPALDPYGLTVTPDGVVYFGGREMSADLRPRLRRYDPATGRLDEVAIPDPRATMIRCLASSETEVYIGTGSSLNALPTSSKAGLWVMDRATNTVRSILPPEFAGGVEVRDVTIVDDDTLCIIGTTAQGSALAFIDRGNPSSYTIAPVGRTGSGKNLVHADGRIYFLLGGINEYDPGTGTFRNLSPSGVDLGEQWGLFVRDGKVWTVSAFALAVEVDLATGESTLHDLIEAGAPAGAQLAMSVAAGAGGVYVGGTNAVSRRDAATGAVTRLFAGSEAKDIDIVNGVGYFGQYSGVGILAHDPATDGQWPRLVEKFPTAQNRPHQVVWDEVNQLLLLGIQNDTKGGGSLVAYDPVRDVSTAAINPIDARQMVRSVATHDGVAYLGGDVTGGRGVVVAWDPVTHTELWRVDPLEDTAGVTGLVVRGPHLYVMGYRGELAVLDLETRAVIHRSRHRDVVPNYGTLLVNRGMVYGTSSAAFFRFDPKTFERTTLTTLNGEWYGIPRTAVDEEDNFYAIKGRNLVRIEVSQR